MSFTPTKPQQELIVELQTAKVPADIIAARLGVDPAVFRAWRARMDAASDYIEPTLSREDFLRKFFPDGRCPRG